MKFATATNSRPGRADAFTLVEVLAALMFMAIVIPVAVEALHIASLSGEVAVRKAVAARVADRVLNENIATTNWDQPGLTGTVTENGHTFRWALSSQDWSPDSTMQLLSARVDFSTGGKDYSVRLNTLASSQGSGTTSMAGGQ
jgi:general secretion pathway protein I